jgi:hypothetical protein
MKRMKMRKKLYVLFCMLGIFVFCGALIAKGSDTQENIKTLRIGYCQSRPYGFYAQELLDIAREMAGAGLLSKDILTKYEGVNFEERFEKDDIITLWNDVCDANIPGSRYQFVKDVFFDMSMVPEEDYGSMVNRDDVDMTITMGTAPGVYFVENEKDNLFINLYAADPIASGIVKSDTERYTDNSYATVDLTPYLRQLDVGYKFLNFKKLGMVYENSETAIMISAVKEVEQKAEEYGFEVVHRYVTEPVSDDEYDRYYSELKQAYRELADEGIDCLYITLASIDYEEKMQELLDDAIIPAGIKTLAQDDFEPLAYGALFGVTISDAAQTAGHVFKQLEKYTVEGVPFNELDMVCEITPRIGLNMTTANRIGFQPGFKNLQMVDRIYRNDR